MNSLLQAAAPKSDQLNADDLMGIKMIATITDIKFNGSEQQPISIYLDTGCRPWKPCKSMIRILVAAYGEAPDNSIGKTIELYCDENVRFGKDQVGGIRISRLSHIEKTLKVLLTIKRGMRRLAEIQPLIVENDKPTYPQDMFDKNFTTWGEIVESKRKSPSAIIALISTEYTLTEDQAAKIRDLVNED